MSLSGFWNQDCKRYKEAKAAFMARHKDTANPGKIRRDFHDVTMKNRKLFDEFCGTDTQADGEIRNS